MNLNEVGEFGLIEKLKATLPCRDDSVVLGIGDDCAIISHCSKYHTVTTTDSLQERVHFTWKTITPYQLGWKALAVNLSDIAAMGAVPKFGLLAFSIPENYSLLTIQEIVKGIADICVKFGVSVIGGNICKSLSDLSITVTLMGEIEIGKAIQRNGAKVGDIIFVTGYPGEAALGLDILRDKLTICCVKLKERLILKHLIPTPRIPEGRLLSTNELATSLIDISDGLVSDLNHICQASRVGAKVYLSRLPVREDTRQALLSQQVTAPDYFLYGGEEYELLFTISPVIIPKFSEVWRNNTDIPCNPIGEIISIEEGLILVNDDGSKASVAKKGFDHFRSFCEPCPD